MVGTQPGQHFVAEIVEQKLLLLFAGCLAWLDALAGATTVGNEPDGSRPPPDRCLDALRQRQVDGFSCLQAQQLACLVWREAKIGARQLLHVTHGPETGQRERGLAARAQDRMEPAGRGSEEAIDECRDRVATGGVKIIEDQYDVPLQVEQRLAKRLAQLSRTEAIGHGEQVEEGCLDTR